MTGEERDRWIREYAFKNEWRRGLEPCPHARERRVLDAWRRFQASPSWPGYVARRVLAGARAVVAEERRLERWFAGRLGDTR